MDKRRIVILGGGESGTGAAVLASVKGFDVFLSEYGMLKPKYRALLEKYGIRYEEGGHTLEHILNADEIIKSPGIANTTPVMQAVIGRNIHVISELEFAARYTDAKKICITGSNGKTTTTSLIYYMMKQAGMNVGLAGNIGQSFALQVAFEYYDYYVLEISNFQLENMYDFKADIAILLNITPDHLDRYDHVMQRYIDAKMRILQNMTGNEFFIFCHDDDVTVRELKKIVLTAQMLPMSLNEPQIPGAYVADGTLHIDVGDSPFFMSVDDLALKGRHNLYNSMAAGIAGRVLDIKKKNIREALTTFAGIEHRMEFVLQIKGVRYINDSKATNINAAWYALESMKTPVVWIVGGKDKGNDYNELLQLVQEKVKAVICLGADNSKLLDFFRDKVNVIEDTHSMQEAVAAAYRHGAPGDTVLLSPACASFDLFKSYEDRGDQFKQCVKAL